MTAERVANAFQHLERLDLRVGDVWLHPNQVAELAQSPLYDRIANRAVRDHFVMIKGAPYVGMFLGARVFESTIVPENHIALVPDGLDATLQDRAACISL